MEKVRKKRKHYSQMRRDFYDKYKYVIVPMIRKYETSRILKLILAVFLSGTLAVLGAFLLYLAYTNGGLSDKSNKEVIKGAFALFIFSYFSWYWIKKSFENKIKEKIMPTVCSCFANITWVNGTYWGSSIFSDSGVVPSFTSEDYDDVFLGNYKGVNIEIVEPEFERGSGKNRTTVFDGVIVKLSMNKKFSGHTVIKPNRLINKSPFPDLKHTEFEDPEFNKKFDVYTNDEVDARYLITPTFMERLKRMKIAFSANNISCAFYSEYIIIALPTKKDIFSICSLVKKIDDRKQYVQMYNEIVSIIKLIDYFKLHQKTRI